MPFVWPGLAPSPELVSGRRQRARVRMPHLRNAGRWLPLQEAGASGHPVHVTAIPSNYQYPRNPSLHSALQDLGYMIAWDLHEACAAFDNPNIWYPGVDGGIDPVPDSHVELVIWGAQRELDRELRAPTHSASGGRLPAAPLARLPWHVQRAFAERRRLRYLEWGLTRQHWQRRVWRLADVPEDDWMPPWSQAPG